MDLTKIEQAKVLFEQVEELESSLTLLKRGGTQINLSPIFPKLNKRINALIMKEHETEMTALKEVIKTL